MKIGRTLAAAARTMPGLGSVIPKMQSRFRAARSRRRLRRIQAAHAAQAAVDAPTGSIEQLVGMGFTRHEAAAALSKHGGSVRAAAYELLNGDVFYTLAEAKIVIEQWRRHYNTVRPHSSLGYKPPAPEVGSWIWPLPDSVALSLTLSRCVPERTRLPVRTPEAPRL
jgi:hypothetical protein